MKNLQKYFIITIISAIFIYGLLVASDWAIVPVGALVLTVIVAIILLA